MPVVDQRPAISLRDGSQIPIRYGDKALLALDGAGHTIGEARYLRLDGQPDTAEVAVSVVGDWRGRGLGSELLQRLMTRTREEGIRRFTGTCLSANREVLGFLQLLGAECVAGYAGTVGLTVDLTDDPKARDVLRWTLRAAAARQLRFRDGARR